LQQNCDNISHYILNVFLHYLANFKCSYTIDYSGHKRLALKTEFFLLKLVTILWATMATFFILFSVTSDGFS